MTKSIYQKEFEEYLQSTLGISKNTLKSYRSDIRHFLTWLGVARIEDAYLKLNAIEANAYKSYLSSSNTPIKTINRHLSSLRHLSRFLVSKKYLQKNFMETIGNAGTLHNPVLEQTTYNPVKTRSINIKPLLAVIIIAFFLLFLGKSGIAKEGISIVASKLGISLPSMQEENTASSTIEPSVLAESVSKDLSFNVNIKTNLLKDLSVGGNATVSGTLTTTGDLTTE
ncbi:MAG TPA: site-specific integrase, partial [Patescibacteria group bacterium]